MAVIKANTEAVGAARTCTNHPTRETLVACGRCLRPFCTDCLIQSPAGLRCYECAGMKRNYVARAGAARFGQAFGTLLLGCAIAGFLGVGGWFGYLIAGAAGSYAGQIMSPAVTRQTRPLVYIPVALVLFLGTWLGWSLGLTARGLIQMSARGVIWNPISVIAVPIAALSAAPFWILFAIVAVVVFLRVR